MDYAEKNGMFFIETSAKTADNINQLFEVFLIFTAGVFIRESLYYILYLFMFDGQSLN